MIPQNLMTANVILKYTQPTNSYNSSAAASKPDATVLAYFQPRRATTLLQPMGAVQDVDYSIIVQPDTDVDDLYGAEIRGETFLIDGPPMPHWNPMSSEVEYIRVDLRKGQS